MRLGSLTLVAVALAGCTALTDFDRFGTAPLEGTEDGSIAADGGGVEPAGDDGGGGALPAAVPGNDAGNTTARVDAGSPTAPELAPVSGSWLVDRDVRSSECNAPSFAGYTWTVSEHAGQVTVQTNSPTGSVQTLAGIHQGAELELTGTLTGNAGTNTVTMLLVLSRDGDTFVGDESSAPRCPTTRRVTGTRL